MTVEVMASFKVKANGKEVILHPGQRVKFNDTIAARLILEGRVRKVKMAPVRIYSRMFNEEIYIVADQEEMEALASKEVREAVYMAWEIPLLSGMDKEKLTAIHLTKRVFPGAALT